VRWQPDDRARQYRSLDARKNSLGARRNPTLVGLFKLKRRALGTQRTHTPRLNWFDTTG
jgi:hypothetical protein